MEVQDSSEQKVNLLTYLLTLGKNDQLLNLMFLFFLHFSSMLFSFNALDSVIKQKRCVLFFFKLVAGVLACVHVIACIK